MGRVGVDREEGYFINDYLAELQDEINKLDFVDGVSSIGYFDTVEEEIIV